MKVFKFGGKSLANGTALEKSIEIIISEQAKESVVVVVSARGTDTDKLIAMYNLACAKEEWKQMLSSFLQYHLEIIPSTLIAEETAQLESTLAALQSLGFTVPMVEKQIVALGELISAKIICYLLRERNIDATTIDAREIFIVDEINENPNVLMEESALRTQKYFSSLNAGTVAVMTGYIASDIFGNTTNLGRNGSNYSATLLASFLGASEVQNWTNTNGIYTSDPALVKSAQKIKCLSYQEANEMVSFGANILHAKTIQPLIQNQIPLVIKNSFRPDEEGTIINSTGSGKGIKAVTVVKEVSLIAIEGRGMQGVVGIDARIFHCLSKQGISIRMISQAASERSIGFVVDRSQSDIAQDLLEKEFEHERLRNDISSITSNTQIAIIAITGRHNYALEKAISALRKNKIWLHLITNSINGQHISLVIDNHQLTKAINVVHNQVVGAIKTLNVVALGKGTVGRAMIEQILHTSDELISRRRLKINIVGVGDSRHWVFEENGLGKEWELRLQESDKESEINNILKAIQESNLENIVIVDNTASTLVARSYTKIALHGCDIIASNKIANTLPIEDYLSFRKTLRSKNRHFFYETNVGAGLPVIDTLKQMVATEEKITCIRGVFSGSLSFIFNTFSVDNTPFFDVLMDAKARGYTEPDPREDLSGNDVGRKLLILAREMGIEKNFEDVEIESLIPDHLCSAESWEEFESQKHLLSEYFERVKSELKSGQVLRYVGEISSDKRLSVSLCVCNADSTLARLRGADSMLEIYTESYGVQPIIIQGAGAGAIVTARGVYSDLIRLGNLI